MNLDDHGNPLDAPSAIILNAMKQHGGARPGAGAPRGPRPDTVARLARLREIANIDEHGEDVSGLSNLDIVQIQVWRLWSQNQHKAAADLALRLLPYHHSRKLTITVTRAEPASDIDGVPPEAPAEPVPPLPRPPKPLPPEARAPRTYDRRVERKLERWVDAEGWRRARTPDEPTRVPPYWREEVESRLLYGD